MKLRLKNFTPEHYLRYIKRQSKHMQHIHAFAFAGTVTVLIAVFILYTDYGFWHETYLSDDIVSNQASSTRSFGDFWKEAGDRFHSIGKASFLEGTETYVKDENSSQ
jgi:hypothetical protein